MSLIDRIEKDIITALKAGDKVKTTVLRGLKSDLNYRRIDKGDDLSDDDITTVLATAAKKRRESIEQFHSGGRDDLAAKEKQELSIIEPYLPEQIGEEELRKIIADAIEESSAESPAQIGLIMKAVMPKLKGRADGKLVNRLAASALAGKKSS